MNLLNEEIKLTLVQAALADGQTDPVSSNVDMAGYDGVLFIGVVGTITTTGTATLVATQATTDTAGAALSGASVVASTSTASDKLLAIDVFRPTKRYLGTTLTRATANSVWGGTLAIQYTARSQPVAQALAAGQMAAALVALVSPAEA